MLSLPYSSIIWIRPKAVTKSAKMFTLSVIFREIVILRILINDKIMNVLYEVSSVPMAAIVTKEMKAATGVQEY